MFIQRYIAILHGEVYLVKKSSEVLLFILLLLRTNYRSILRAINACVWGGGGGLLQKPVITLMTKNKT